MEISLAESQTDSYFPTKWPNVYPKQKHESYTHIQRRTITKLNQDRRTALERSVKSISLGCVCVCVAGGGGGGGGELKSILHGQNLYTCVNQIHQNVNGSKIFGTIECVLDMGTSSH